MGIKIKFLLALIPIIILVIATNESIAQETELKESDKDSDGISDRLDQCPFEPENYNGFEDTDGCPDLVPVRGDQDGDGILDIVDPCPTDAENYNGFEDTDGCPDIIPVPTPKVSSIIIGSNSILIKWVISITEKENYVPYRWILEKSNDLKTWEIIADDNRSTDEKKILETGEEIHYYIDEKLQGGLVYYYRLTYAEPDGKNQQVSSVTEPIEIPIKIRQGYLLKSIGTLIETKAIISPQPVLLQEAKAQVGEPIIITSLNPQGESYLIALSPIPSPTYSNDGCHQVIEIIHNQDQDLGQIIRVTSTVIEDQTPQHQEIIKLVDNNKREFARFMFIDFSDQVIQNYTNLKVQLDFQADFELNPLNWRSINVYEINFYVPEDNGAC